MCKEPETQQQKLEVPSAHVCMACGAKWVLRKWSISIKLSGLSLSPAFSETDDLCDSYEGCYQTSPTVQHAVTFSTILEEREKGNCSAEQGRIHTTAACENWYSFSPCSFPAGPVVVNVVQHWADVVACNDHFLQSSESVQVLPVSENIYF